MPDGAVDLPAVWPAVEGGEGATLTVNVTDERNWNQRAARWRPPPVRGAAVGRGGQSVAYMIHVPLDMRLHAVGRRTRARARRGRSTRGTCSASCCAGSSVAPRCNRFACSRPTGAGPRDFTRTGISMPLPCAASRRRLRRLTVWPRSTRPKCSTKPMPERFRAGQRLGFDLRVRPIRRRRPSAPRNASRRGGRQERGSSAFRAPRGNRRRAES